MQQPAIGHDGAEPAVTLREIRSYQTLINETLKSSVQQADIADTLRQVIREEIRGKRKAA